MIESAGSEGKRRSMATKLQDKRKRNSLGKVTIMASEKYRYGC